MKPFLHARISAARFGGDWTDYQALHDFFDLSKGDVADMRHRALLHSDWGCESAERLFGSHIAGASTSALCEQHQMDDLGRLVTLREWISHQEVQPRHRLRRLLADTKDLRDDPLAAMAARLKADPARLAPVIAYHLRPRALTDGHTLADWYGLNAFSIMLSDRIFGPVLDIDGAGRMVPTRDIGELLARAFIGRIPTLSETLQGLRIEDWMLGSEVLRARREARAFADDLPLTD